ncbi:MAG: DUF1549 domain-containing protein [Planctomycetes bacterium]|nr:DUF1549 domain-containing protein [Planctomycetota bacterium]
MSCRWSLDRWLHAGRPVTGWRRTVFGCLLLAVGPLLAQAVLAQEGAESLSRRIDQLLSVGSVDGLGTAAAAAPIASDQEFVRRVYLDLAGRVPSPQEAREFVADQAGNKREVLIDRLIAAPEFTRHFATALDVMLQERRPDKAVSLAEWQKYLFDSVAANKPFDQLAREILSADGVDPAMRPAAKFYLDRDGEPNLLTRDIGRIFFGVDLQCAQCHDHPLIDDFYQTDYYGLYAFVNRSFVYTDKKDNNKLYFAEKADGDVNFSSVFTKKIGLTDPRLPTGDSIADPVLNPGEEYTVAPAENVRPVPKYSRRAQLAALATGGSNRAFNRNLANRLWAFMMGRGLVEPVDLHHAGNPPSNPKVLDAVTDEVVRQKFNMRAIVAELARTQAYQRSYEVPMNALDAAATAALPMEKFQAERAAIATMAEQLLKALEEAAKQRDAANEAASPLAQEFAKATAAAIAAWQAADKANAALAESQKQLAAKQEISQAVATAATASQEAAKRIPDDKELAGAAEKFAAKATSLATELAAAQKSVADLTPPAKAADDALVAARNAKTEAAGKLAPVQAQWAAATNAWFAAAEKSRQEHLRLKSLDVLIADTQQLLDLRQRQVQLVADTQAVEKLGSELTVAQQTLDQTTTALPGLQAEIAGMEKIQEESRKQLEQSQLQVASRQEVAKPIADAAAQAAIVKSKLPNDAEIGQAADRIQASSEQLAAQVTDLQKVMQARESEFNASTAKVDTAKQALATMTAKAEMLKSQLPAMREQIEVAQARISQTRAALPTLEQSIVQRSAERFYTSPLRALTPEQLGWSVMKVAGLVESHRLAVEAELNKTAPLDAAAMADPARRAERNRQLEAGVDEKLKGNLGQFVSLYGSGAGQAQEYFATVDQALFFSNGGTIAGWLAPAAGNLTERLLKLDDAGALAEELYMTILSRKPVASEVAEVSRYLASRGSEKTAAVQELAWGLLATAEFRFNH